MADKKRNLKIGRVIAPISAEERREIDKRMRNRYERLRKRYPEVYGKVVDFISHTIEDGMLYFTVRFKDDTSFSVRYTCTLSPAGAELSEMKAGNARVIRKYRA